VTEEKWKHPARGLLKLRRVEVACVTVMAVAGVAVASFWAPGLVWLIPGVLVLGALFALIQRRRFEAWGYAERADDLLVARGVMFERLSVIPYGRMQFIDVTAGPLERIFGLATVKMHTAAVASNARIPGLERAEAERLRDRLAELGEAQAAGL
jgi:membrane protein YdbS with pleckstrin-like domain